MYHSFLFFLCAPCRAKQWTFEQYMLRVHVTETVSGVSVLCVIMSVCLWVCVCVCAWMRLCAFYAHSDPQPTPPPNLDLILDITAFLRSAIESAQISLHNVDVYSCSIACAIWQERERLQYFSSFKTTLYSYIKAQTATWSSHPPHCLFTSKHHCTLHYTLHMCNQVCLLRDKWARSWEEKRQWKQHSKTLPSWSAAVTAYYLHDPLLQQQNTCFCCSSFGTSRKLPFRTSCIETSLMLHIVKVYLF